MSNDECPLLTIFNTLAPPDMSISAILTSTAIVGLSEKAAKQLSLNGKNGDMGSSFYLGLLLSIGRSVAQFVRAVSETNCFSVRYRVSPVTASVFFADFNIIVSLMIITLGYMPHRFTARSVKLRYSLAVCLLSVICNPASYIALVYCLFLVPCSVFMYSKLANKKTNSSIVAVLSSLYVLMHPLVVFLFKYKSSVFYYEQGEWLYIDPGPYYFDKATYSVGFIEEETQTNFNSSPVRLYLNRFSFSFGVYGSIILGFDVLIFFNYLISFLQKSGDSPDLTKEYADTGV